MHLHHKNDANGGLFEPWLQASNILTFIQCRADQYEGDGEVA